MSVLGRYMTREISSAVLFVLVAFLALFAFFDFIEELDDIGRGGYGVQHALAHVLLGLPGYTYELLPIAVLIGAIYALSQFASHSEFTVMRAAGMGRRRALAKVSRLGLLFVLMTAVVGELLTPAAESMAQRVRLEALGGTAAAQFRSGVWLKDTLRDESGEVRSMRFVNVGEVQSSTRVRAMRVFEFDREFRLRSIVEADSARFVAPASWLLTGVTETRYGESRGVESSATLVSEVRRLPRIEWPSELRPEILGVLMVRPDRMSAWNLWRYIGHLKGNRQAAERYEIAFWKKIIYPFAAMVMLALALPFAYLQARAGGIGYKVFAGIMLGIAFHLLNGLFSHIGLLTTWPPWLAAATPSIAAFALALVMLYGAERVR
ncbi:MAG: LPS export ABC transporter permease LptG [Burkholderiales bacterium]|nr:MAG: LPS export ABC transporter permease LptG [Burkholderiales bacterium]